MNSRAIAATILKNTLEGRSLTQSLTNLTQKSDSFNLIQEMCYGVMRWYFRLDFFVNQLVSKPLKQKDNDVYALLLIGLYQLEFLNIPDYAVLQETVEACKSLKKIWAKKFVNAILRNFQRQQKTLNQQLQNNPEAHYAHPTWLINQIKQAYPKNWEKILNANNKRPPLSLRINLNKISREEYINQLLLQNISAKPCLQNQGGIILAKPQPVKNLLGFHEGFFAVQDNAAQLAAELLNPQPHERILDACAAPGGKTCHLLEIQPKLKKLVAIDKDQGRIKLITDNLNRLNLQAEIICADACHLETWWNKKLFDRILLDAPCSATGVIRRHPDIKYLRKSTDILPLQQQQLALIKALWPILKPGGILLYATCSVLPDENEKIIYKFLQQTPDAQETPITIKNGHPRQYGCQLLPGQNDMDGFYYASLKKN